jgi:hypothetical protein
MFAVLLQEGAKPAKLAYQKYGENQSDQKHRFHFQSRLGSLSDAWGCFLRWTFTDVPPKYRVSLGLAYALGRAILWRATEHAFEAEIIIQGGPMQTNASPNDLEVPSFWGMLQSRVQAERRYDDPSIGQA